MTQPTHISATHPALPKIFSRFLYKDVRFGFQLLHPGNPWAGDGPGYMIRFLTENKHVDGSRVQVPLVRGMRAPLVYGNNRLKGKEGGIEHVYFEMKMDQVRQAGKVVGRMTEQRVSWSALNETREALSLLFLEELEMAHWCHLCGFNAQPSPYYTLTNGTPIDGTIAHLANPVRTPDPLHLMRPIDTGAAPNPAPYADDQAVAAGGDDARMSVALLERLRARAKAMRLRPMMIGGKFCYCVWMSPEAWADLFQDQAYREVQLAELMGGQKRKYSPFFSNRIVHWKDLVLIESEHLSPGVHNGLAVPGTSRVVLTGGSALACFWGKGFGPSSMSWVMDTDDYENEIGVAAGTIMGADVPQWEDRSGVMRDYGRIVATVKITQDQEVIDAAEQNFASAFFFEDAHPLQSFEAQLPEVTALMQRLSVDGPRNNDEAAFREAMLSMTMPAIQHNLQAAGWQPPQGGVTHG